MAKKIIYALLDHFESYICQILLVFFVVTLFAQIVLRSFGIALSWSEEISRYSFLWFILFGASYATRISALNRVTIQFNMFPGWVKNTCLLLGDLVWLGFSLAMAWYGYIAVQDLAEFPYFTPALDWNLSKIYYVFPLSFLLMAIRIVQVNIIKYVLKEEIVDPDQEAVKESQNALVDEGGDE